MSARFSKPEHEPALSHDERRGRGVFYTPREIAEWITRATYGPLVAAWNGDDAPPRVLDPACGGAVFLLAAADVLNERCQQLRLQKIRIEAALSATIFGIDIDPEAIQNAREQLPALPVQNIRVADTLQTIDLQQFDAIIGNPPYVSIRDLARSQSRATIALLRDRYRTARGNFDLYVPFWERSLELLRPGGRLGFIVPNKWATLDYARPLREMLLSETSIEQIIDLSALRVFPQASAYPQIVVLRKIPPAEKHRVSLANITQVHELAALKGTTEQRTISQQSLSAAALVLGNDLAVEDRVATQPLGSVAELHSGSSGYSASLIAGELRESAELSPSQRASAADFIVTGNIDRYSIAKGNVRFLKRRWHRPCLPLESDFLTEDKQRLYREPKIVISGMCRRLEAAYDKTGFALGVQVFAARECQIDPYYLLAILNSKLLSYLFRERFGAKRLAGGYLAINKGQLAQLPVAIPTHLPATKVKQIVRLARQLQQACSIAADEQLDELIYQVYQLTPDERLRVERAIDEAMKPIQRRSAA
jgi:SAM-dependent methyltransferase